MCGEDEKERQGVRTGGRDEGWRGEKKGGEGRGKERGEDVNEELWEPAEISLRSSHRPAPGPQRRHR